jgi:hypothetical protein
MKQLIQVPFSARALCTAALAFIMMLAGAPLFAFSDKAHKNTAEDAIVYMETTGTNQQRWAADYLKAKAGGRTTGGTGLDPHNGDGTQYGLIGIIRAGAVAPDYFQDIWWDDSTTWGWNAVGINFTSWTHFINLLITNEDGNTLKYNNYNNFDGYSWNGSYAFPNSGIDWTVASYMNNAWMTIDLANCSDCSDKYTLAPNGNPAVDYRQNGSTNPLGSPHGSKAVGSDDGTNYNCYSDCSWPQDCPDRGDTLGGLYQIPNTYPGDDDNFTSNQDWVIFEPLDNAATFYYNEFFLEGGASRNNHLDTASVAGRYYSINSAGINWLTLVMHYAGDSNIMHHVWNTSGYNHSDNETWIEGKYGNRSLGGGDTNTNYENYAMVGSMLRSRSNRGGGAIDRVLTENAFLTYLLRYRAGYDVLTNTDDTTRKNAATQGVNQAIASIIILYEKGVMDLRNYR